MGIACLKAAVTSSQVHSRAHGYGMWILNIDQEHPDSDALPKPGFRTDFLQKWLREPPASVVLKPKDDADDKQQPEAEHDERMALQASDSATTTQWAKMVPLAYCDPRGV